MVGGVRELFDNAWLRLFALDGKGRMSQPYGADLQWQPALGEVASAPAPDSAQPANKPFRPGAPQGVPGVC
jgi:hypothetical protein